MKLSEILFENEPQNTTLLLPLKDLVVSRNSLFDAYDDCRYRRACSKTEGPIQVYEIDEEPGKYQLYDGYHRLFEYLLGLKHKSSNGLILATVGNSYSNKEYWAVTPINERWIYKPSKKYGNLEDFFGKGYIGGVKNELDRIAKMLLSK